jgi:hypothetical protein
MTLISAPPSSTYIYEGFDRRNKLGGAWGMTCSDVLLVPTIRHRIAYHIRTSEDTVIIFVLPLYIDIWVPAGKGIKEKHDNPMM